jgi:hypothetical protein
MASVKPQQEKVWRNARSGCWVACCDLAEMAAHSASHRRRGDHRQLDGPKAVTRCNARPAVHAMIYGVLPKAGPGRATPLARLLDNARNRSSATADPRPQSHQPPRQKTTCGIKPGLFVTEKFQGIDPAEHLRRQRGQDSSRQIESIFLTNQT